jgi:branched-chain amino acid transport system permease protein
MTGLRAMVRHRQRPAVVLALAAALAAIPVSGSPGLLATAVVVGMYAAIAVPLGLLLGHGGVLSVAQASFAALGAYSAGILATETHLPPYVTLVVAVALPALVATLLARPILRLPPLALVIATLAFGSIAEEITARWSDLTGGRVGLIGIPPLEGIGTGMAAYAVIWGAVVLMVAGYANLVHGSRGRALNAARADETLARSVGVAPQWELTVVFTLAAGLSGAVGWFYAHYIGFLAPQSLAFVFSAAVLLMVIVGGRSAPLGPVIGAVFYVAVQESLPVEADVQNLIFGLMLAFVLVFLPSGLASIPSLIGRRLPASRRASAAGVAAAPGARL